MTLVDRICSLRPRLQAAIEAWVRTGNPAKEPDLNDLAVKGAQVAMMMATDGYGVTDAERKLQVDVLLEKFLTADIADYQAYLELRGYVRGFRDAQSVEMQIVARGAHAEQRLKQLRGDK